MASAEQGEIFDIVDVHDQVIGQKPRKLVHRDGDRHRAVNVFIFRDNRKQVLLQKRAANKDVCPCCWDLSCAEHLQPGEAYDVAARRGMSEELSIDKQDASIQLVKIAGPYQHETRIPEKNIWDREMHFLYCCDYEGPITMDETEVAEIQWVDVEQLEDMISQHPEDFTTWMLVDWKLYKSHVAQQ
jgi:isopentenyl-diphosphate delta-isomerase type 1